MGGRRNRPRSARHSFFQMHTMNAPITLSPAALEALALLAQKPASSINPLAYRELVAHDFVMAGPDEAHITQRGKTFWLRSQGKEA